MSEDEDTGTAIRRDRFSGGPARGFLSSLTEDERIFQADLAVDRAHVVMLAEHGIVDAEEASEILGALEAVEDAGYDALPAGEDVHEAIESAVIDEVGDVGGKMHTARSRNDEVATCLRFRLREDLLALLETISDAREVLLEAAEAHVTTTMPGYTHLQPAQPVTVGHWLCSYESALRRDTERLLDAFDRVNRSPLGAGAFAGVSFDIDRERTASLLGFHGVLENSADAVAGRDFLIEVAGGVCGLAVTLSGIAEDGILFANRGYLDIDDAYASTSSIMPQKVNPDTLELVRASAGDALAGVTGVVTTVKGLPRAYNRDLQRADTHVWQAIDQVTAATEVAAGAIATGSWNEEVLEADAGDGFSTATGVADLLAQSGLPFRRAHEVVALAAERAGEEAEYEAIEAAAQEVLGESLSAYVTRTDVETALDPEANVAMRSSFGGPAPDTVSAAIERAHAVLDGQCEAVAGRREVVAYGAELLQEEVNAYR